MNQEQLERDLGLAMQRVLSFAKQELPTSFLCVMSFTAFEVDGQPYSIGKIATNTEEREELVRQCAVLLNNFLQAPVHDLRDTIGGMQ